MSQLDKVTEMLRNDPSLVEKLAAEARRLAKAGEKDVRKVSAEAIRTVFGAELTDEELDQVADSAMKQCQAIDSDELDPEALDAVSGGGLKSALINAFGAGVAGAGTASIAGGIIGSFVVPGIGSVIGFGIGGAVGAVVGGVAGAIEGALMPEPGES